MKHDIVTSEAAKLLMSYILPVYDEDEYMLHVFQAIGKEMDQVIGWVKELEDQPYPQFATFTLPYWEEVLGIEVDDSLSYKNRRSRIVTKLSTYFPITKQKLESIASSAAGAEINIDDFIDSYMFRVNIEPSDEVDLFGLIEEVNQTKPAHLGFVINQRVYGGFYMGCTYFSGEELTVYPWTQNKDLETRMTERIGIGYQSVENISIYPEGGL